MAEGAQARGYAYLAITDHSASHGFGNHVTAEELLERVEEVAGLQRRVEGPIQAARRVRGQHRHRRLARLRARGARAARLGRRQRPHLISDLAEEDDRAGDRRDREPQVDCIGHLTGRLINKREPYEIDVEAVAAAAAEHKTLIEINGNPNRRDLSESHARLARDAGVKIVVNTDAHGVDTLANIQYGLATARRAWLTKADIANTRTWKQLLKLRGRDRVVPRCGSIELVCYAN